MQTLAARGIPMPDIILIIFGHGGDGKSLFFNHLLKSVFGTGHGNMSSRNLQVDREFQQQGEKFLESRWLNFDECNRDAGLVEDLVKNFIAGGWIALRKNHAGETDYACWPKSGKSWLVNNDDVPHLPSAQEKSWQRRIRGLQMKNNFDLERRSLEGWRHHLLARPNAKGISRE